MSNESRDGGPAFPAVTFDLGLAALGVLALVAVAIAFVGVTAPKPYTPPRRPALASVDLSRWDAKPGGIVVMRAGERVEFVEKTRAARRCRYCRRADGARASDHSCAGCGARDFDGVEPPAPPTAYVRR